MCTDLHSQGSFEEGAYAMAHCVEGRIAAGESVTGPGEVIGKEMVEADGCGAELLLCVELRVCHCSGSGRVMDRRQPKDAGPSHTDTGPSPSPTARVRLPRPAPESLGAFYTSCDLRSEI